MFVTHQLNAYNAPDGIIIADMVVYDSHDSYSKYFYTDFLTKQLYPSTARILRFRIDTKKLRVMYNYILLQETIAAEFPQINHEMEQKPYQWAYIVEHPFAAGNGILKVGGIKKLLLLLQIHYRKTRKLRLTLTNQPAHVTRCLKANLT